MLNSTRAELRLQEETRRVVEISDILKLQGDIQRCPEFTNDMWIQRDPDLIESLKKELVKIFFENYGNQEWIDKYVNTNEWIHPHGIIGRIMSDCDSKNDLTKLINEAWYYIGCISTDYRMFTQPYFASADRPLSLGKKGKEVKTPNSIAELRNSRLDKIGI